MASKRITSLDVLRVIAVLLVILCHVTEQVVPTSNMILYHGVHTAARMGVPIFLMLTGYLVLSKDFSEKGSIRKFYKKKLLPLVIVSMVFSALFYVYAVIKNGAEFSETELVKRALLLTAPSYYHLWYLPVIIGLYLGLPFVSLALSKTETRDLVVPMLAVFLFLFLVPEASMFSKAFSHAGFSSAIDWTFTGGVYGSYVILGYLAAKGKFTKAKSAALGVVTILSLAFETAIRVVLQEQTGKVLDVWYDSPFLLLSAVSLFELVLRLRNFSNRSKAIFQYLSTEAFSIYLLHVLSIDLALKIGVAQGMSDLFRLVIVWIFATIVAVAGTAVLRVLPGVRKLLMIKKVVQK